MKLYPLFPVLFIITYLFVGISIAIQTPETALTGVIVLAAFIGLYFITKSFRKTGYNLS